MVESNESVLDSSSFITESQWYYLMLRNCGILILIMATVVIVKAL